jgi:hypothetical protein
LVKVPPEKISSGERPLSAVLKVLVQEPAQRKSQVKNGRSLSAAHTVDETSRNSKRKTAFLNEKSNLVRELFTLPIPPFTGQACMVLELLALPDLAFFKAVNRSYQGKPVIRLIFGSVRAYTDTVIQGSVNCPVFDDRSNAFGR